MITSRPSCDAPRSSDAGAPQGNVSTLDTAGALGAPAPTGARSRVRRSKRVIAINPFWCCGLVVERKRVARGLVPRGSGPGGGQAPALQPQSGPLSRGTYLVPAHRWAARD